MATRIRIDRMIVERGLVDSREKATKLIMAGDVFVDGERVDKAGALISPEAEVELRGRSPYVSRGGEKLTHALDHFNINVVGKMCIDVGASTGGFTDCLLQRGASRVYAVDVGTGQLDARLRRDPRVVVMEQTNARTLDPRIFGDQPDRKSTRLNSSHDQISYAVFCLKKKKKRLHVVRRLFTGTPSIPQLLGLACAVDRGSRTICSVVIQHLLSTGFTMY